MRVKCHTIVSFVSLAHVQMSDAAPAKNNPADFLKTVLGRPVVVKLNSGVDYRGASAIDWRAHATPSHLTGPPLRPFPPFLRAQVCWHALMAT